MPATASVLPPPQPHPPHSPPGVAPASQDEGAYAVLIDELAVAGGMDVARINCAHDEPAQWQAMAAHVREAARAAGRVVRILMDLGGPKLRTGPLEPGPAVLKIKPRRDACGALVEAAAVGLRAAGASAAVSGAAWHLGVDPDWLARLERGDRIDLRDARDAGRSLQVRSRNRPATCASCASGCCNWAPDTWAWC